jgi:hypothetical protein
MFLLGGTAFSGKTLLALLLNQNGVVCLDEPDFHDVTQRHRGIRFLKTLFPNRAFPAEPDRSLSYSESVAFLERCERVIGHVNLGMKTAGWSFLEYAKVYRESGYPVIAVIRDIRDVLAEAPLPHWVDGEPELNSAFRAIWTNLELCDLWIRYEDLVARPGDVLEQISTLLDCELQLLSKWSAEDVHPTMFKLGRHDLLREGSIAQTQAGVWKSSGRPFSTATHETAAMMGYGE